jgi:hypothetical protein
VGSVGDIRDDIAARHRPDFHCRTLSSTRKITVSKRIAQLPDRGFVIAPAKRRSGLADIGEAAPASARALPVTIARAPG